jgi:hypothetical protein
MEARVMEALLASAAIAFLLLLLLLGKKPVPRV